MCSYTASPQCRVPGRSFVAAAVHTTLQGHTGPVWSVGWSPDDTRLATGQHRSHRPISGGTGARSVVSCHQALPDPWSSLGATSAPKQSQARAAEPRPLGMSWVKPHVLNATASHWQPE